MKYLKYALFIFLCSFIFISITNAETCNYGNSNIYFSCSTTNGSYAKCEIRGSNASKVTFAGALTLPDTSDDAEIKVTNEDVKTCSVIYADIKGSANGTTVLGLYGNRNLAPAQAFEYKAMGFATNEYDGYSCSFSNPTANLVCTIKNGVPNCNFSCNGWGCNSTMIGSYRNLLTLDDFINNQTFICPTYIYYSMNDSRTIIEEIAASESTTRINRLECGKNCATIPQVKPSITDNSTKICTYENGVISFTCTVTKDGVSCNSSSNTAGTKKSSLKPNDFNNNGSLDCFALDTIYVDGFLYNNKLYYYDINSDNVCSIAKEEYDKIKEPGTPANNGSCLPFKLTSSVQSTGSSNYEDDASYKAAEADANKYCNPQDIANYDSAKCSEAQAKMAEIKAQYNQNNQTPEENEEFDINTFCNKPGIKPTFRVIGWVIFAIKIIVPILIIVLASIDFGKAVVASKEDEIKKTLKSLVIRSIIGIVIFLLPTLLDFIVGVIGGSDLYDENSGSLGACTHCMLKPYDNSCSYFNRR